MKNLIKISIIVGLSFLGQEAMSSSRKSDTLKVIKKDGEIVMIILNNIKDVDEVKTFDLNKIISNIEENKGDFGDDEILISGDHTTYQLKESNGKYYLSELSKKQNDTYVVRIFENTSQKELEEIKNKADEKGIDITYQNLEIINGKIEAITLFVDCNDGWSGTASTTNMPETGIGFIRDYSENTNAEFLIGKVFEEKDTKSASEASKADKSDDFGTAFNEEKVVKKSSFIKYNHEIEFSLGLNNYLNSENQFPDNDNRDFSLDPLTSWTYGIHSNHQISVSPYVKFNFQLGLLWNNFALADNNYQFVRGPEQVEIFNAGLERPEINPTRSKLNITYLNFNLVPMFHLGKSSDAFRFGVGPYGSYRIASKSKFKYDEKGKDLEKNNFHLNNWKYGVKAQIGWKGVDLFATYDLSPIFIADRGPEVDYPLRAISFGVIF